VLSVFGSGWRVWACVLGLSLAGAGAQAQVVSGEMSLAVPATERSLIDWLTRLQQASQRRAYVGTFVVSSGDGVLSSARIWHVCDGKQQIERVDALTGTPRSTFRRNSEVVTFLPEPRVARFEQREGMGLFPGLREGVDPGLVEFYQPRQMGVERVAGLEADVVALQPRDGLRFGYRIWSERRSGLAIKVQTLDADGRVLEQAAFSEIQMDAPVRMDKLVQLMNSTEGWRVERSAMVKTTAEAEGWALKKPVAGFKSVSCYRRSSSAQVASQDALVQWVFSDGLASVSLFLHPLSRSKGLREGLSSAGATHMLTQRVADAWMTAVGEVPPATLKAFASALERRR